MLAAIREEVDKLSPSIKRLLDCEGTESYVSVASLWEAAITWRLGKLPLPARPERLPELMEAIGFVQVPVLASHAVADVEPEPATRDPFDRLLLAQCKVEGYQAAHRGPGVARSSIGGKVGVVWERGRPAPLLTSPLSPPASSA